MEVDYLESIARGENVGDLRHSKFLRLADARALCQPYKT